MKTKMSNQKYYLIEWKRCSNWYYFCSITFLGNSFNNQI